MQDVCRGCYSRVPERVKRLPDDEPAAPASLWKERPLSLRAMDKYAAWGG